MFKWNAKNLGTALGCEIPFDLSAENISTDSRKIRAGDIFIALKGENFDGNEFALETIKNGAAAAIVSDIKLKGEKLIYVEDTLKALQRIGKWRRKNSRAKFIAITGSVGKTSTKEMLFEAISTKYTTFKTEGNLNNHIGLPLTLANMPQDIDVAILELGMNHAGEISDLVRIANPHVAAVTWVSEAHIENLGSVEKIARAKAEIFEWLADCGVAVIPADNNFYEILEETAEDNGVLEIHSFGNKINSVLKLSSGVNVNIEGEEVLIAEKILKSQVLNNILLVLTVAKICDIDLEKAIKAIGKMEIMHGRGGKFEHKSGAIIIDDSYNASPTSMINALEKFKTEKAKRKIVALGDMRELGDFAQAYHENLAEHVDGVDMIITCGKLIKTLHEKVKGGKKAKHFDVVEECFEFLDSELKKGDMVLIKGSHGSNMWKIVDKLNGK